MNFLNKFPQNINIPFQKGVLPSSLLLKFPVSIFFISQKLHKPADLDHVTIISFKYKNTKYIYTFLVLATRKSIFIPFSTGICFYIKNFT